MILRMNVLICMGWEGGGWGPVSVQWWPLDSADITDTTPPHHRDTTMLQYLLPLSLLALSVAAQSKTMIPPLYQINVNFMSMSCWYYCHIDMSCHLHFLLMSYKCQIDIMSNWYGVILMSHWCHIDVILMSHWCHIDVILMSYWWHIDDILMA